MGVDAADFDQDGWQDLFVANIDQEMYLALHEQSRTKRSKMLAITDRHRQRHAAHERLGPKFFDYDNDGESRPDHRQWPSGRQNRVPLASVNYREPMLLFHNNGKVLQNVSPGVDRYFECRCADAAWPWAILITTAPWMC